MIKIRRAAERGRTDFGWLDSRHTFSFGDFNDPTHMGFRDLRVINDDRVKPGQGFGRHGHRDMEILSYVLEGALEHQDSSGGGGVIRPGEIQMMRAGTGVTHSEFNHSKTEPVHFLQIWLLPSRKGLSPSYAQESFSDSPPSEMMLACSTDGRAGSIKINQDVELFIGRLDPKEKVSHPLRQGRHAWVQLIEGDLDLNGRKLSSGDGASLDDEKDIRLESRKGAHFLLFDLN